MGWLDLVARQNIHDINAHVYLSEKGRSPLDFGATFCKFETVAGDIVHVLLAANHCTSRNGRGYPLSTGLHLSSRALVTACPVRSLSP